MIAVMYRWGVTSKAGLIAVTPGGAVATPWMEVTSSAGLSSI
jgi:hypothetical protein